MNGRTFRLFWLPVTFAVFASLFPDRIHYLWSLVTCLVLFLGTKRLGNLVLRRCLDEDSFHFPLGLGILLLVAYGIFIFTTGKAATCILWTALLILALFEIPLLAKKFSIRLLWASPFLLFGFWSCVTPPTFFDALVYHLGLPHQYLVQGKMQIIPHHLYSVFPPFDQVLNLLFAGVHADAGIKIFSIVVVFGIIHSAVTYIQSIEKGPEFRAEYVVIPFLAIPGFWILVHLMTADLLTALFFSSGVFLLLIQRDRPSAIAFASILIAFSCWTKWNVLLYLPLMVILFATKIKRFVLFAAVLILLLLPLLIRNYVCVGDPLYPILSVRLSNPNWSVEQEKALALDSFPARARTLSSFLISPIELITNPDKFGSASEIGLVPIFLIVLSPFAARRKFGRLILYIVVCFFAWLFVFPNFRQFIPVFVLIAPILFFCWNWLANRSSTLFAASLIAWGLIGLYSLLPIYRDLFPLISINQNRDQYLSANVRYYPIARDLKSGKALLIGETRSAYFQIPLIVCTAYDRSPFEEVLKKSSNAQSIFDALKEMQVSFVVYDSLQFQRLSEKYGLWKISAEQQQILQEFVKQYTIPKLRVNGIYLLQLK